MAWVSFNTVHQDLVNLLNGVESAHSVLREADERDYHFGNMPLIDVRLSSSTPEVRSGRDYYVFISFDVQISAYHLSGFDEAATLRDTVLAEAIDLVRSNASFSSVIETSRVGPVEFSNAKDDTSGAFMAAATFEVITESFVDN